MIDRFGSYLASKPKRAAVLILTLVIVLVLVLAGWALQSLHFGRAPYPSEKVPISLVDGKPLFTMDFTQLVEDSSFNYTGMKIAFGAHLGGSGWIWTTNYFGDQSLMSTHAMTTMHEPLMKSSFLSASIDITDSTGDGAFDLNDTILFEIVPLSEDTVYTMGLFFVCDLGETMTMELSFAVHDGKLYAWNSHYLNTEEPWFGL